MGCFVGWPRCQRLIVIELDNNATTRPGRAVVEAAAHALAETWHNPSSIHRAGQAARRAVELARASIARLVDVKPRELVFTSGGTEALDLAIKGLLESRGMFAGGAKLPVLVTTKVEHAAIRELAEDLSRRRAAEVRYLPVSREGRVDVAASRQLIAPDAVVAVQWANNETGAIQPVRELGEACRAMGASLVVDATQWVGKMPADLSAEPFDAAAFAPHKWHGPKGVGVLWARGGVRMRPQVLGTQELGRRGGTENVPAIVGAGVAAEEAIAWLADPSERERGAALRDRFERAVMDALPDVARNSPADPAMRLWNTSNLGFANLEAEALLLLLSEQGVAASAGAACSSGSLDPSPVLLAMGVPESIAHGSLRFSLSRHTTREDVDRAAEIVVAAVARLRKSWK
jgi:cysteine desulfurase